MKSNIDKDLEWFVKSHILDKHRHEFSYKPEPDKEKDIEKFIKQYYPDISEENRA